LMRFLLRRNDKLGGKVDEFRRNANHFVSTKFTVE
jgi:hypothetical protein